MGFSFFDHFPGSSGMAKIPVLHPSSMKAISGCSSMWPLVVSGHTIQSSVFQVLGSMIVLELKGFRNLCLLFIYNNV